VQAPRLIRRVPRSALVTLGVAAGLFAARDLGELVPDSLAASVCMFAAGYLAGWISGARWARARGPLGPAALPARDGKGRP
jgi:hypothetical protein